MKSAMKGKRVPIAAQCNDHTAHLAGIRPKRFFTDATAFARSQLLVTEYYGFDAPNNLWDVYNIEAMRLETGNPGLLADGNDAWASPPLITLDMMDEYVVAYTESLRHRLGAKVVTRGNWGDAQSRDPERFMAQKLKCSPGFLSALDPDLCKVGPERVKAFASEHDAFVTAGIDATLLYRGSPKAITERIRYYINTMATDGRFAVYLNQIPSQTPPDHIHAAVAACRAYGRLPLSDNLAEMAFEFPQRESFSEFLQERGEHLV